VIGLVLVAQPTGAQPSLAGRTVDYTYGATEGAVEHRAWTGRAYLHPRLLDHAATAYPVVVYLHGINKQQVQHPWMGAQGTPDLRSAWDRYLIEKRIAPAVLAAPSSTVACKLPQALWDGFDMDRFLAFTVRATRDQVRIDLSRVVVIGHSGAGCNHRGGLVTALQSTLPLVGGLIIDVCMDELDARPLALARPDMDVVVTYQRRWQRDFPAFSNLFVEASRATGATGLRQVEEIPMVSRQPHTDIVMESLDRWLPRWIPPAG
jgi:hypothetical protein